MLLKQFVSIETSYISSVQVSVMMASKILVMIFSLVVLWSIAGQFSFSIFSTKLNHLHLPLRLVSQGGYAGFQVTGMIEWGQKSKPRETKKTPPKSIGLQTKGPKNPWTKI